MLPSAFVAKAEELGLKWVKESRHQDGITITGAHGYASRFFTVDALTLNSEEELTRSLNYIKREDDYQHDYEHLERPANEPL